MIFAPVRWVLFASVAFSYEAGTSMQGINPDVSSTSLSFRGTERFPVVRKLGAGGMGVVYEARDSERNTRVALKTLPFASADALLRFKQEFRDFQHLTHPNLVSMGELCETDGVWFFTMELVEGVEFLSYVRKPQIVNGLTSGRVYAPSLPTMTAAVEDVPAITSRGGSDIPLILYPGDLDAEALTQALGQLARGLICLHDAGKVHRDVKSGNILIQKDGRLVLLDFGLATDASRKEQLISRGGIVGTPVYMAPEQAAEGPVGPPADWYGVGVLLYQALTGRDPFAGPLMKLLMDKQFSEPPAPRTIVPDIPAHLNDLCVDLLALRPEDRPNGRQVLRRLGLEAPPHAIVTVAHTDTHTPVFVGRDSDLGELDAALESVRKGKEGAAVYVHGESGVGKSALVAHFVDRVRTRLQDVVILSGRCYEHEAVPYKALDGVVDTLSRYLARLSKEDAAALLPRHATLLAQTFPVLWRVEAIAEHPRPRAQLDPQELRSRVFAALRELLTRLADRRLLLITIDDLQWADPDSMALLGELLRQPDSPQMLMIATVRVETPKSDPDSVPLLARVNPSTGEPPSDPRLKNPFVAPKEGVHLWVNRLEADEARLLAETLIKRAGIERDLDADMLIRDAGGHPMFIDELVRHRLAMGASAGAVTHLDDALWARINQLDAETRTLLEVVSLAPGPITQATATKAANLAPDAASKHIKVLKVAHLAATIGGTRGTDLMEPYHDRVRTAVRARVSKATRRAHHRRIALVLETTGQLDPEALTIHWREAGELDKAAHNALLAAERAETALAFDHAARFYSLCLELSNVSENEGRRLRTLLGTALVNAGRGREAADVFRTAARGALPTEALDLRRRATEQLLRTGHIDAGLSELRGLLGVVRIHYPTSPIRALISFVWGRLVLNLRGLSFKHRQASQIPAEQLARIDTCWAVATGIFAVDQLRGLDFQIRHLLMALRAGEPSRVLRGLGMEAVSAAALGGPNHQKAKNILARAEQLTSLAGAPYDRAFAKLCTGSTLYLRGEWLSAYSLCDAAENEFRSDCRGVAWEIASGQQIIVWALCYLGRAQELVRRVGVNLRESLERGDLYAAMSLRSGFPNFLWLVQDNPAKAREEANAAVRQWSLDGFHLQHLCDAFAQCQIDLYEGNGTAAFDRCAAMAGPLAKSGLMRVQFNRIVATELQGRVALAAAHSNQPERLRHLRQAKASIESLKAEHLPWADAHAALLEASLLKLEGRSSEAVQSLHGAIQQLERVDMIMHAAAARLQLAALDSDFGRNDTAARRYFDDEGFASPEKISRMLVPALS